MLHRPELRSDRHHTPRHAHARDIASGVRRTSDLRVQARVGAQAADRATAAVANVVGTPHVLAVGTRSRPFALYRVCSVYM